MRRHFTTERPMVWCNVAIFHSVSQQTTLQGFIIKQLITKFKRPSRNSMPSRKTTLHMSGIGIGLWKWNSCGTSPPSTTSWRHFGPGYPKEFRSTFHLDECHLSCFVCRAAAVMQFEVFMLMVFVTFSRQTLFLKPSCRTFDDRQQANSIKLT